MDSYQKLINYIFNELKKVKAETEDKQKDLEVKNMEISNLNWECVAVTDELETKRYHLVVVKNYNAIISDKKLSHFWKAAWKSILIAGAFNVLTKIFPSILQSYFAEILFVGLEAGIIGVTIYQYFVATKEEKTIKNRYEALALENYVAELEKRKIALEERIKSSKEETAAIELSINNLKEKGCVLTEQMEAIKAKRNTAINNLALANEPKLDLAYKADSEIMKLERKLRDGENI